MLTIGLDLHKRETQLCIVDASGAIQHERRLPSTRPAFTARLGGGMPARILLEAGTKSEWVAQHLEALGHEVHVADPNYAPMYATRHRAVKTDRAAEAVPQKARPARRISRCAGAHELPWTERV
jgi:transposase